MIIQKIKDYLEESNSQGILIDPEQLLELIGEWETEEDQSSCAILRYSLYNQSRLFIKYTS